MKARTGAGMDGFGVCWAASKEFAKHNETMTVEMIVFIDDSATVPKNDGTSGNGDYPGVSPLPFK